MTDNRKERAAEVALSGFRITDHGVLVAETRSGPIEVQVRDGVLCLRGVAERSFGAIAVKPVVSNQIYVWQCEGPE